MEADRQATIASIVQLVWYMRGSIQYKDMLDMSMVERQAVSRFIEKRLEAESKRPYPQY